MVQWRKQHIPDGGGGNLKGGATKLLFWPHFLKNRTRMKKIFDAKEACVPGAPRTKWIRQ